MSLVRLSGRAVERVWGRTDLPGWTGAVAADQPIGEIWFEDPRPGDAELLVKFLFTSARLSIQVHPGDDAARAAGHARGKDEAWLVLDAEPGATIGIGLVREMSRADLRAAALSGTIEQLLDWRPVAAGDVFYSPAGTIHAIGAGIALIEVQQNLDLTYRLYDYGRPRELHLDQAVSAAVPGPFIDQTQPRTLAPGRTIIAAGPAFTLEQWQGARAATLHPDGDHELVIVQLAGTALLDEETLAPGTVWSLDTEARLEAGADSTLLVAYPGAPPGYRLSD